MKKIKHNELVTERHIDAIIKQKYKDCRCPSCNKLGIYAGGLETQYNESHDEDLVLSFSVFCKDCGGVFGKWDNSNSDYWLSNR